MTLYVFGNAQFISFKTIRFLKIGTAAFLATGGEIACSATVNPFCLRKSEVAIKLDAKYNREDTETY
jgi:hypothetical protein